MEKIESMDEIKSHPFIKTDRLILRQWNKNDFEPFARINADPKVQKYFPKLLTREESDHKILQYQKHIEKFGWGFWVVSLSENGECIGTVGLQNTPFQAHFVPAVCVGWRLAFEHWGKGYATEGALAVLRYGFETLRYFHSTKQLPKSNLCINLSLVGRLE